jgi:tRNA 2-thiouridine synthesizing protein D
VGQAMGSFAFMVCTVPYTFENSDTLYAMIDALLKLGHKVSGVFFYIDGVINISKNIKVEAGVRNLPAKLQAIVEKGIPVIACSACSDYRGITVDNIAEGTELAGLMTFSDYIDASDKIIVFGL